MCANADARRRLWSGAGRDATYAQPVFSADRLVVGEADAVRPHGRSRPATGRRSSTGRASGLRMSTSPMMVLNVFFLRCSVIASRSIEPTPSNACVRICRKRVVQRAAPVVGVDAGHFLVRACSSRGSPGVLDAAGAQDVFGRGAEFAAERRKRDRHRAVVGLHVQAFDLGLLGQPEGVRRIGPGDERIRIGGLRRLHHRRQSPACRADRTCRRRCRSRPAGRSAGRRWRARCRTRRRR